MGLIKAGMGAVGGMFADQWKEFFYCDSLSKDVLVTRGQKQKGRRSSNTKGHDNIISNGSKVAVADGQCMIIVDQGKVVELCAEPGEFTYDTSTEPSIFTGDLGESIKESFRTVGKRFTFGGDTGKDQRIYYFNTKEIMDNKFGTPTPFMFRIQDVESGLPALTVSVRCNGIYSYRITDPIQFYENVCGNVTADYERSEIDSQLKMEFIDSLQPAFAELSKMKLLPSEIPAYSRELKEAVNKALLEQWARRGISVENVAMNPISLKDEDLEKIQKFQERAALRNDPSMAAATLIEAQASAMEAAASNPNGAMMGFMGMNMASQAGGGVNAQDLYNQGQQQRMQQQQMQMQQQQMQMQQQQQTQQQAAPANSWNCGCGSTNTGKFCMECGGKKPEESRGWVCTNCNTTNLGKFCMECGSKKPMGAPLYQCDKCGWEPEDPTSPPKFCPECGDHFDENDIK